jgi:hypothetical protein
VLAALSIAVIAVHSRTALPQRAVIAALYPVC